MKKKNNSRGGGVLLQKHGPDYFKNLRAKQVEKQKKAMRLWEKQEKAKKLKKQQTKKTSVRSAAVPVM